MIGVHANFHLDNRPTKTKKIKCCSIGLTLIWQISENLGSDKLHCLICHSVRRKECRKMFLFQSVHTFAHILDGAVCAQIQNNLTASNIVFVACGPSALASVNFISFLDLVFADYSQYNLHS